MFKKRSLEKELLDNEAIPTQDLFQNLKELEIINKTLGGFKVSGLGLKATITDKNRTYTVVDIGCGGGDFLKFGATWAKKNNYQLKLVGVDIKDTCITYAKKYCEGYEEISLIQDDFRNLINGHNKPDIIHASLFFHHLEESEIKTFIEEIIGNKITLIINDLDRHPLAYYGIKLLTSLFSKSYLVKNDAPLSVLRGFKSKEWEEKLKNIPNISYKIKNIWAFRHLIIIKPKN